MLQGNPGDPLIEELRGIEARSSRDCWSFKSQTTRTGAHALLHYPAMMVPSLQGLILDAAIAAAPDSSRVLDPFAGSGTVLVEAMTRGLHFEGVDINPLAGLACLVKGGPYFTHAFHAKTTELIKNLQCDRRTYRARSFTGREKWFDATTASALEKVCAHIRREPSLWARRLYWLALARVVRSVCKSRISTYKLHLKLPSQAREADATVEFVQTVRKYHRHVEEQQILLRDRGLLRKGRYRQTLTFTLGDVNQALIRAAPEKFDVVMTSPPYGDNTTTIPYGQFSYLPLQWIDLHDIGDGLEVFVANTHATDSASLGGSLRRAEEKARLITGKYKSARQFNARLRGNDNGRKRFAAFFADLDQAVASIARVTAPRGVHAWTISNRRIGGLEVPMVSLLHEMLELAKFEVVGQITRGIHFKKMALKNALSDTMSSETILLARKIGG